MQHILYFEVEIVFHGKLQSISEICFGTGTKDHERVVFLLSAIGLPTRESR